MVPKFHKFQNTRGHKQPDPKIMHASYGFLYQERSKRSSHGCIDEIIGKEDQERPPSASRIGYQLWPVISIVSRNTLAKNTRVTKIVETTTNARCAQSIKENSNRMYMGARITFAPERPGTLGPGTFPRPTLASGRTLAEEEPSFLTESRSACR